MIYNFTIKQDHDLLDPVIVPATLRKEMNDKALFMQVINDNKPVKYVLFNFSLVLKFQLSRESF